MNTREAYNQWAEQYDSNENKTRDLEAIALRELLSAIRFDCVLEIGCGTGKNSSWLAEKASHITAVDLSEEMLAKARTKPGLEKVQFVEADITRDWNFTDRLYDMVVFSLMLEHIDNLDPVFKKAAGALSTGGHVYVGELHPFKQYSGSKARFDTEEGQQVVTCFNHHISEFIEAANKHGLRLTLLREYFDDKEKTGIPRILALVFRKDSTTG